MGEGKANPFIDPEGYRNYIASFEKRYNENCYGSEPESSSTASGSDRVSSRRREHPVGTARGTAPDSAPGLRPPHSALGSFVSQGDHRIQLRRTPCRNPASQQRNKREQ